MSKWLTQSLSQDVDSRRPEHIIKKEEKDAEDEDDDDGFNSNSNEEEKKHAMVRTEDHIITTILLTINLMQEKIDSIMMKLGLDKGSEAVVVIPQVKRPKKTLVSRSASSFYEETSQTSSISANDSAMVCTLTTSLPTYDSRGEPQKLYEFIQKHNDFFDVVELTSSLVLVLAPAKLNRS